MDTQVREFTIGFVLPSESEKPVDDRAFLGSLCTFGAFLRWRMAKAFYETGLNFQENEALKMTLSLGIWEQMGAQLEDLVMFLVVVPNWVAGGRQCSLADLYSETQIRSKGPQSPGAVRDELSHQTANEFLKSLGLPVDPNQWPDAQARDSVRLIRRKLTGLLGESTIIRPVFNKLKHGPQMIVSSLAEPAQEESLRLRLARILLKGARTAMAASDPEITHVYLEDSGHHISDAVDQIEFVSRALWLLASWVYFFSFGSFAHLDIEDGRFQPSRNWWASKKPSNHIW